MNLGRVLGSIWEGFGAVLGFLWLLLAASWPLFERSKSSFFQALAQNGLQEGFWMDFGSLWEDFGKVLGGVEEKFWKILELPWHFSDATGVSTKMGPLRCLAPPRGASQYAGVPPPAWLDPAFLEVWAEGPTEWGSHGPPTAIEVRRTFSSWAPSWLQVRIFSQFVCIFFARCFEVAFFTVSRWFLNEF